MTVSGEDSKYGLEDDWASVQKALEEIVAVYDKTNRYISLGTDLKLRKIGIDLLIKYSGNDNFTVLDLGCGTGKMSMQLMSRAPDERNSIILVDPITSMARSAKSRTGLDGVISVFESLAFREDSFEAAMAGFSIRDSRNLSTAFAEIGRVLKAEGRLLIVDLSKPTSRAKSALIYTYWRAIAPVIAVVTAGKLGLKFGILARTFQKLPRSPQFLQIASENGFKVLASQYSMMGGACVLLLAKCSTSSIKGTEHRISRALS